MGDTHILIEDLPEAIFNRFEHHSHNLTTKNLTTFERVEVSLLASLQIPDSEKHVKDPSTLGLIVEVFLISTVILCCLVLFIGLFIWLRSLHGISYRILPNVRHTSDIEQAENPQQTDEISIAGTSDGIVMHVPLLEVSDA